jgi:hypothetical protein
MSWRSKDDFGLELVGHIYQNLRISDHWASDLSRGFMWWAEEFCQMVWCEVGAFQIAETTYRLHAETELLRGRGHHQDFELALAREMKDATLSAVIYDHEKDTFVLHSSVYATSENVAWIERLFLASVALQVDEAHHIGHDLAKAVHAVPATSAHPAHGLRSQPDPLLGAIDGSAKAHGAHPSRWIGLDEWKRTEWAIDRQASRFESDHQSFLKAWFPWPLTNDSIELEITTHKPHAVFGNGLDMVLRLPVALQPGQCAHTVMELNKIERSEWLRCHMMGSWGFAEGRLQFECFVPNMAFHDGVLLNMGLSMAIRANWVADQFAAWYSQAQR